MMKKNVTILCLIALFLSCKKSKNDDAVACGIKNPIQNLSWLSKKVERFSGGSQLNSVVLYQHKGNQIIQVNQSVSSKMYDVYNCSGESLMFDDANGLNDYLTNRKKIAVLYGSWE